MNVSVPLSLSENCSCSLHALQLLHANLSCMCLKKALAPRRLAIAHCMAHTNTCSRPPCSTVVQQSWYQVEKILPREMRDWTHYHVTAMILTEFHKADSTATIEQRFWMTHYWQLSSDTMHTMVWWWRRYGHWTSTMKCWSCVGNMMTMA